MLLRRVIHSLCFAVLVCLMGVGTTGAQETTDTAGPLAGPTLRITDVRAELEALPETADGDTEGASQTQLDQRRSFLNTAIARLEDSARQEELRVRYASELDASRQTLTALRNELDVLQTAMNAREPMDTETGVVGEAAMFATEQELLTKESELRTLQSELDGYRTQLAEIGTRLTAAPRDLAVAREQLAEVTAALTEIGTGELDGVGQARRKALRARDQFRRTQIAALEAEIASLPTRQEIVAARRNLAELRTKVLTEDVLALQDLTGQRKVVEARSQAQRTAQAERALADLHPVVTFLAAENVELANAITAMAADEPDTSRRLAAIRGQTANVQNDLDAARKLIDLDEIDRQAGATLRRLGSQLTSSAQLRADLRATQRDLARLTRQRVVAQEQLRDLPLGAIDPEVILERARRSEPTLPDFDDRSREAVIELTRQRRDLLRQTAALASSRVNAVGELATAQQGLLDESNALRSLLDENLLWVPSVPAIGLAWPQKVVLGAAELFSPAHIGVAGRVLMEEARRLWPVVLLFIGAIALAYRIRPTVWREVVERADMVGKIRKDSLWHTPVVVGAGFVMALPLPLAAALLTILYGSSDNPDLLVRGLANGFAYLSVFLLIFMTWVYWDREKSLLGAHFKFPKALRLSVQRNLRWFVPVMGGLSFLLAVVSDTRGENIYEGFGLAVFIATALTLAVFSFRIVWRERAAYTTLLGQTEPTGLARYRTPISLVIVGLPLFVAVMAGAGWFESAADILWRMFLTGWILLFTYVIYGSVRRAITVAQRQIKYRQAVERREAQIKARRDQQAAEERGEEMPAPPPIDTTEIDVSAMSRQSAQLLRTLVLLGLAALLWFNWASLFPALTIFDGLEITRIQTGTDEADQPVYRAITLFTVLQAFVIGAITVIAARNLPGFLEIFILDRLGVDAGARYAVVTILGYIIVGTGIVLAFQRLGLQWSQLRWIVTGLSVGIGFGLQKIIANFVSGLILLFERPIRIGDYVTIGDQSGTVTRIKIRATTLMDLDNREILIPNENLISQEVTNWTLSNSTTRLVCMVGIAYGSDTDKAREIMLDVLKNNSKVLDNPPPNVLFVNFGDSSLDFELRCFLNAFEDRWPVKHAIHTEVNKALAKAGFEIPFPQRDLNIRAQDVPLQVSSPRVEPPRPLDYGDMVDPDAKRDVGGRAAE